MMAMFDSPSTVVIAGLTGAGKSLAAQQLESFGYVTIDALPPIAVPQVLEESQAHHPHLALVTDLRRPGLIGQMETLLPWLRSRAIPLFFLEARDEVMVQRLTAQRRRHFFVRDGLGLVEAIQAERLALESVRQSSILVLDTSDWSAAQLRQKLESWLGDGASQLRVTLISFGFKFGVPLDANLMFDVRFLPNPFFDPQLRSLTGQDVLLQEFLFGHPQTRSTYQQILQLIETWLPSYQQERRAHLTLTIGCTGGQHRSVALVERLAQELLDRDLNGIQIQVIHRHLHLSQQEIRHRFAPTDQGSSGLISTGRPQGAQPHV